MGLRWRSFTLNTKSLFLFLYLKAFGGTGGIEKFNRAMMKALELRRLETKEKFIIYSAYDQSPDPRYHGTDSFVGFNVNKIRFTISSLLTALKADTLLIGHINLSLIAFLMKIIRPGQKQIIVTHGIEVWGELSWLKRKVLRSANSILAVSNFTRNILIDKHRIPSEKVSIFRNTLDPYFGQSDVQEDLSELRSFYRIPEDAKILMTIARLKHYEKAKGYDKVIEILARLKKESINVYYILAGKYSEDEHARIQNLARELNIAERIILPGFIEDKDMKAHYTLADIFVMPSTKEGFGIVFIEAMACGTPAIAGNKDGSADTILSPDLGTLVDPDNLEEIYAAVINWIAKGKKSVQQSSHLVWETFGFQQFCKNVSKL